MQLWQGITGVYEGHPRQPVHAGLVDGTLPDEAFAFYVIQDSLYLEQYVAWPRSPAGGTAV